MAKTKRQKTARGRRQGGKGKPFVPGDPRSNLAGRPPLTLEQKEFKELCKQKAPGALQRIEEISLNGSGMTALLANEYLVDRAHGKPKAELELDLTSSAGVGLMVYLPAKDEGGA